MKTHFQTYFVAVNPNINEKSVINNITNNYCPAQNSTCNAPEMPDCSQSCEY